MRKTDLDRFIELYRSLGIELNPVKDETGNTIIKIAAERRSLYGLHDDDDETYSDKFKGYSGFYSDIKFDSNGNFICQGFWE